MVRWAAAAGPICAPVIVALGTKIDRRVVLVRKDVRGRQIIIARGTKWISNLVAINAPQLVIGDHDGKTRKLVRKRNPAVQIISERMLPMLVMAGQADHSERRVIRVDRLVVHHGEARRTNMAATARQRVHVRLGYRSMTRTGPFFIGGILRTRMTPAANRGGNLNTRNHRGIIRVGSMVARRTVAILALDPGKLRGRAVIHKTGRQAVPNGVTRQTRCVLILPDLLQRFESLGVVGVLLRRVDRAVALNASWRTRILRRRPKDFEQSVGRSGRNAHSRGARHVGAGANRLPRAMRANLFEDLVVTRRPVPGKGHRV